MLENFSFGLYPKWFPDGIKYISPTKGREYGSGGRDIGIKLSEQLGCPLFDKEIINEAAKRSSINRELFERFDEKALSSTLYSMAMSVSNDPVAQPLTLRVQKAYGETIHELAKDPCVIIGRSADYLLRDCENLISFFIISGTDSTYNFIVALAFSQLFNSLFVLAGATRIGTAV